MRSAIVAACAIGIGLSASVIAGSPSSLDYYPAESKRLHEEGITRVKVCVDDRGTLTSDPVVTASSGHARLDEAAVKLAKAGSGRYKPATRNGKPVADCAEFNVTWKLR